MSELKEHISPPKMITPELLESYEPPTSWWGLRLRNFEAYLSKLSTRSTFWNRLVTWKFLPLAYHSGASLGKMRGDVYEATMPFKAFNKNWYNAMAGAALLANSEVIGGTYIFSRVGANYTVVCKELNYRFRRPCVGPAIYRVKLRENIDELLQTQLEFNITADLEVFQAAKHPDEKERKVGVSVATFHVAPKALFRARQAKFNRGSHA